MKNVLRNETEQDILVNVIRDEIELIFYLDAHTDKYYIIMTNEDSDAMPALDGVYSDVYTDRISENIHPEDKEHCLKAFSVSEIKKKLEEKQKISVSYRMWNGKEYRRKEMKIYYQYEDRKTLVFVRRDVTDAYEEARRQKERLYHALLESKHANREKGEFLERMSHEIRTPMNSIIGLSYLSRENLDNKKQISENLDKIDMSAHFLLSFVNDILNLSQTESGNIALNEEVVNFDSFLNGLTQKIRAKSDRKKLHFSCEKRGLFEKEYCFDAEKLECALYNMLLNAVKFTQIEGKIDFIAELLRQTDDESTLRFEIRDNGCGIDEAFLPRIFEPFEQEDNGITTLAGGTGLGLAIARNNIEYLKGKIDVYSEKGSGTTFVVTIKVKEVGHFRRKQRKQNSGSDIDYDFTGKRVLLVEDNDINIEITKNILDHKNFSVEVATDGKMGVEKFMAHESGYYDVILMDIRMPVMDGLTATRKIRASQHADHARIPIIAMTANAFEEDVKKSFEAGMDAHLSKPMDIGQMYSMLDGMIYG